MAEYKVLVTAPPILPNVEGYKVACLNAGIKLYVPDIEVKESLNGLDGVKKCQVK